MAGRAGGLRGSKSPRAVPKKLGKLGSGSPAPKHVRGRERLPGRGKSVQDPGVFPRDDESPFFSEVVANIPVQWLLSRAKAHPWQKKQDWAGLW